MSRRKLRCGWCVLAADCNIFSPPPPGQGFKTQAIGFGPDVWSEGGLNLPLGRLCELGQCVYGALCELSLDAGAQLLLRVTGGGVYMTQPPGLVIPEA